MFNTKVISISIITVILFIIATFTVISLKPQMHKTFMLEKIIIKKEAPQK